MKRQCNFKGKENWCSNKYKLDLFLLKKSRSVLNKKPRCEKEKEQQTIPNKCEQKRNVTQPKRNRRIIVKKTDNSYQQKANSIFSEHCRVQQVGSSNVEQFFQCGWLSCQKDTQLPLRIQLLPQNIFQLSQPLAGYRRNKYMRYILR